MAPQSDGRVIEGYDEKAACSDGLDNGCAIRWLNGEMAARLDDWVIKWLHAQLVKHQMSS